MENIELAIKKKGFAFQLVTKSSKDDICLNNLCSPEAPVNDEPFYCSPDFTDRECIPD